MNGVRLLHISWQGATYEDERSDVFGVCSGRARAATSAMTSTTIAPSVITLSAMSRIFLTVQKSYTQPPTQ